MWTSLLPANVRSVNLLPVSYTHLPYAITKYVDELYDDVFARPYGMEYIGLRYFNVFGRRQDPHGAYAAVIPLFVWSRRAGGREPPPSLWLLRELREFRPTSSPGSWWNTIMLFWTPGAFVIRAVGPPLPGRCCSGMTMMTVVTMNVRYTLTMGICPKHRHHRHHRHRRRFLVTSMGFVLPPGNPSPVRGQPRRPAGLVSLVNRPKGGSWTSDRTPQRGELVRTRSVGINVRVTPTEKKRILKA